MHISESPESFHQLPHHLQGRNYWKRGWGLVSSTLQKWAPLHHGPLWKIHVLGPAHLGPWPGSPIPQSKVSPVRPSGGLHCGASEVSLPRAGSCTDAAIHDGALPRSATLHTKFWAWGWEADPSSSVGHFQSPAAWTAGPSQRCMTLWPLTIIPLLI